MSACNERRSAKRWLLRSGLNVQKLFMGITSSLHPIAAHRYLWCADSHRGRRERGRSATLRERQCTTARESERESERERERERERMDRLICSPAYNNVHADAISDHTGPYVAHVLHSHTIGTVRSIIYKYAHADYLRARNPKLSTILFYFFSISITLTVLLSESPAR